MKFEYVNVVGKGCEGWLNLFFGEHFIALIDNVKIANLIRSEINEKQKSDTEKDAQDAINDYYIGGV